MLAVRGFCALLVPFLEGPRGPKGHFFRGPRGPKGPFLEGPRGPKGPS